MRKSFKYILAAAVVLFSLSAFADEPKKDKGAIKLSKDLVRDAHGNPVVDSDGNYTLHLETYVEGEGRIDNTAKTADVIMVLDVSGSMKESMGTKTRMQALKDAVNMFVTQLQEKSIGTVEHRVSIITFGSGASNKVSLTKGKVKTNKKNLEDAINGLTANGATRIDAGMKEAYTESANFAASEKFVIVFTDGTPTDNRTFNKAVANTAIGYAESLKDVAKIYAINVYPNAGTSEHMFMNYVSSNYRVTHKGNNTTTTAVSNPSEKLTYYNYLEGSINPNDGKAESQHGMYLFATNEEQLNKVFDDILKEVVSAAGAGYEFSSSVNVKDIVTPSFIIPKDVTGNSLVSYSVYGVHAVGTGSNVKPEFDTTPKTVTGVEVNVDGNTVKVSGFNPSDHWFGIYKVYENGSQTENPNLRTINKDGQKLCIDIKITPDPDAEGGVSETNVYPDSGIYDGDEAVSFVKPYEKPRPIIMPNVDLIIRRPDMAIGESTIYKVTCENDSNFSRRVVVTAGQDGNKKVAETRLRVTGYKDSTYYRYTVEEEGNWDWTNKDCLGPVTQQLINVSEDGLTAWNDNKFEFSTDKKESLIKHDEDFQMFE